MAHTLEDMVAVLKATTSPFGLANDLQIFQEGLADTARRIQALEHAAKPQPQRKPG
jgi:hypothetical protein